MPAIVAKQLNELGKVRVQTEGFRDATDVVMAPSVVICTRLGNAVIQGPNCREFGNFGRRIQRCGVPDTQSSPHSVLWRTARHSRRYLKPFFEDAMVLHLADKTSASTTSAANSMLAISENVACNGCAWKWRPRSVLQCIGSAWQPPPGPPNHIPQKTPEHLPARKGWWGDV
jgi:hypothetical protein